MRRLHNTVKNFAWGSADAIPSILGLAPDGMPWAELWLGAHQLSHSRLVASSATPEQRTLSRAGTSVSSTTTAQRLDLGPNLIEYIAGDPVGLLGESSLESFGPRLPFLLKILSAGTALSIQVHPDGEQAAEGFAREEASGPHLDAPDRSYKDPVGKPELIHALTEFHALTGFRPRRAVRATFERFLSASLTPSSLDFLGELLTALKPLSEARALSRAVDLVLGDPRASDFAAEIGVAEIPALDADSVARLGSDVDPLQTLRELAADFPGDPGILIALMLNRVHLRPGESLAIEPGVMHAYLGGTGIEIMASSDNVLRGGLTTKHIDAAELRSVARFSPAPPKRVAADAEGVLRGPAPDFALQVLRCPRLRTLERRGAAIALCTSGTLTLTSLDSTLVLERGQSVFIPADDPAISADGHGDLFVATTALSD